MTRFKISFLTGLLFLSVSAIGGNSFVFLADTSKLFFASNNEIYSADKKQLLYFQKGNIFFNGSTDSKENIVLLTTSMDITSDKLQLLYEKNSSEATYSFSKNKFYLGDNESEDFMKKNELIHVERMKKWLTFYSSINDSLLGYYIADSLPPSTAVIVAYTLIKNYGLEKKIEAKQKELPFQNSGYATIKPVLGNRTANEWIWDGKVLRPRWNVDPQFAWVFDGQIVKQQYATNINEQYSWDGENFKPYWKTNQAQEWSWDGRMMKPVWDTDWANQYIIENGVVKPWSNVHTEKEWQMDGDIPIPLIILVVSGIAKSY